MNIKEIESIIEAILFAAGDEVDIDVLSDIIEIDRATLKSIINRMMDYYNFERRGIQIIEVDNCYQLCSKPEYHQYIKKLFEPKRKQELSKPALETLAIIAYNQPVIRTNIEAIRGVNCDRILSTLIEKGLIEEKGRLDALGRPILYGTTKDFLRCFGLKTLNELPDFNTMGDNFEYIENQQKTLS